MLLILVALIIVFSGLYTTGIFETRLDRIGNNLDIDLDLCQIVKINEEPWYTRIVDNGACLIKITCSNQTDKEIKSKWNAFPISPDLKNSFPMGERGSSQYRIPDIEKGYYYFEKHFDDYTVAVYDSENRILYYYTLDI